MILGTKISTTALEQRVKGKQGKDEILEHQRLKRLLRILKLYLHKLFWSRKYR
jgi:hypothetical protein